MTYDASNPHLEPEAVDAVRLLAEHGGGDPTVAVVLWIGRWSEGIDLASNGLIPRLIEEDRVEVFWNGSKVPGTTRSHSSAFRSAARRWNRIISNVYPRDPCWVVDVSIKYLKDGAAPGTVDNVAHAGSMDAVPKKQRERAQLYLSIGALPETDRSWDLGADIAAKYPGLDGEPDVRSLLRKISHTRRT